MLQDSKSVVSNELSDGFRGFGQPGDGFTPGEKGRNDLLSTEPKEKKSKISGFLNTFLNKLYSNMGTFLTTKDCASILKPHAIKVCINCFSRVLRQALFYFWPFC